MAQFQYPSFVEPVAPVGGETVTEDKWHQGWTDPVRQKIAPQLAVALIASALAFVEASPFAETVTESRWHQPWSEPVRVRPALPAPEQQALAFHPAPVVPFDWRPGLSESVRVRPALPVGEQHVFEFEPAPIIKIDWFASFSEPVRTKPRLAAGAQQDLARPPWPDVNIAFAPAFNEPVRVKPGLLAALQPYEAGYDVLPLPFLGGGGGWYLPGQTTEDGEQRAEDADPRHSVVRRPSSVIRQVAPKIEPPTFAEVLGSQQPTRLADVFGSGFAQLLPQLRPPAPDLWLPPDPADTAPNVNIPPAALDAIADEVDARDAIEAVHALDELDRHEREALIALVLAHFARGA